MTRKTIALLMISISLLAQKSDLKTKLDAYIFKLPAPIKVCISVNSLTSAKTQYHRNANQLVPAASLIKLPILIELYAQAAEEKLDLDDKYTFLETDVASQDGALHQNSVGKTFTFKELSRLMMIASDNSATNILIKKLSKDGVNARMKSMGFNQLYLNRKMMDTAAINLGIQNFISTREMNLLLQKLYNYEVLTKKTCITILNLMTECNDKTTFSAQLPDHIKIAHKTGSLNIVRSDAGIVFTQHPFIISATVEGFKAEAEAEKILADLAKLSYDYFQPKQAEK